MNETCLKLGLTGWPLQHSLSPRLHKAALEACGLSGEYLLYPIEPQPDPLPGLQGLLKHIHNADLHGLNVTIPYKQTVLPLLDDLTPTARAIGAANTLFLHDGRLNGDNTDAEGFLSDLEHTLGMGKSNSGRALVLGAGGAARAVVYALAGAGWQVKVATRRIQQAVDLVNDLGLANVTVLPLEEAYQRKGCDLLVNATALGMPPHADESPWPLDIHLPAGAAIYDLVYHPAETRLIKTARATGLQAANGLGKLVEQAALAFERWSGKAASRQSMRQAIEADAA